MESKVVGRSGAGGVDLRLGVVKFVEGGRGQARPKAEQSIGA